MQRSRRQPMPATVAPAPSVSMSDTLLALLQEDAQPQETVRMSLQCRSKPG